MNEPTTPWIKATASDASGQCVEQRRHLGSIEIRDTKNRQGATLRIAPMTYAALIAAAKNGDLDQLAD